VNIPVFSKPTKSLKEAELPSGAPVLHWIQPGVDANPFTSVYIEPSQFYPPPQPTEKLPATTLRGITQAYDQALRTAFATELPLADGPGQMFWLFGQRSQPLATRIEVYGLTN
jgi:hypothetical protein